MTSRYFGPDPGGPARGPGEWGQGAWGPSAWGPDDWGEPVYVPEPPPSWLVGTAYPQATAASQRAGTGTDAETRAKPPIAGWLLVGTAVLCVLGAVLPWATVFGFAVPGTDGDGRLVVVFAVAIGVCGLLTTAGRGRAWAPLVALGCALLVVLIALVDIANVTSVVASANLPLFGTAHVAGGLWLTLSAGILATGVAAIAFVTRGRGVADVPSRPDPAAPDAASVRPPPPSR